MSFPTNFSLDFESSKAHYDASRNEQKKAFEESSELATRYLNELENINQETDVLVKKINATHQSHHHFNYIENLMCVPLFCITTIFTYTMLNMLNNPKI